MFRNQGCETGVPIASGMALLLGSLSGENQEMYTYKVTYVYKHIYN